VAAVIGPVESVSELRDDPAGRVPARACPQSCSTSSAFGRYTAEYAQEGRELRIVKRISGTRGTLPPGAHRELVAWLKEMGQGRRRFVVLEK
jgi:hypothetical protein